MLLSNITDVKGFVPVSTGLSFEGLSPFIETVEEKYLKPLIGETLYARLEASYEGTVASGSAGDEEALAKALHFAQKTVANLAVWEGFILMGINYSDKGARRTEGEEHKSLYKYQEDEAKDRLKNTGFDTLDLLLAYLEEYVEHFPGFMDTDTYTSLKASIIKNTAVFQSVYHINNSRLVFLKLKPYIDQVIDLDIIPVIGQTLYNETITEIQKANPSDKISNLVPYLQKPIVFLAMARGLKAVGVNILDKGVITLKAATGSTSMREEQASDEKIGFLAHDAAETGTRYLEKMKQFLVTNATIYTTYSGQTGSVYIKRDNTNKKTFWT